MQNEQEHELEQSNPKQNSAISSDLSKWMHQGKPLRVLSTSLGVALALNLILAPIGLEQIVKAEGTASSTPANPTSTPAPTGIPKLVESSNEDVKKYFDATMDWSLPETKKQQDDKNGSTDGKAVGSSDTAGNGSSTVIVNNGGGFGGGFGWDDLLLYHLIFNSGRPYSSNNYYSGRPVYVSGSQTPYTAKSFDSQTFQNRPVANSAYAPRTSVADGSITRRSSTTSTKSTSSNPGGIGGKSSGVSSSSSSSSSSGGFGG
jgi:hypothetical protein